MVDSRPQAHVRGYNYRWRKLRDSYLRDVNWRCEECGNRAKYVHHIEPVSVVPGLVLSRPNLRALCTQCHVVAHRRKSHADK